MKSYKFANRKSVLTGVIIALILCVILLVYVFGWRIFGFKACIKPENLIIHDVQVSKNEIFLKASVIDAVQSYDNYITKNDEGNFYIGLKYRLFTLGKRNGMCDIVIKEENIDTIDKIYILGHDSTKVIWEENKKKESIDDYR